MPRPRLAWWWYEAKAQGACPEELRVLRPLAERAISSDRVVGELTMGQLRWILCTVGCANWLPTGDLRRDLWDGCKTDVPVKDHLGWHDYVGERGHMIANAFWRMRQTRLAQQRAKRTKK